MAYADLATIQDTDPGDILTAAWCDQVRDNEEFLIDPPACSVFASAGQVVNDATVTTLTANSETFDNDSMHSTSSNTSRITAQTAGRYDVDCRVNFQADITDGRRVIRFLKNGVDVVTAASQRNVIDGNSITISGSMKAVLAAGEYIEVQVFHNAGNNLSVTLEEFAATFITR